MTHAPAPPRPSSYAGIAYMCAGVLMFVSGDALVKSLLDVYSVPQIAFVKSIATLAVLTPWLLRASTRERLKTKRTALHVLRNLMGLAEMACFFIALRTLPLADATAIYYAAPLIATALSVAVLKERVTWPRWAAVVVGFLGMLLIIQPGGADLNIGFLFISVGALLYASLMIVNRHLGATETTTAMVVYAVLSEVLVMGALAPFYWMPLSLWDAAHMALLGLIITAGIFAFVRAYMLSPVATVAPFDYTALIWAVLFGYLFWGELPSAEVWLGAGLIMACGLYILHRERIEGILEADKGRPFDHHD